MMKKLLSLPILLVSLSSGFSQSKKTEEKLNLAFQFHKEREADFAIAAIDELIQKHPAKTKYRILRAIWLGDFAMFDDAAEDFRDVLGVKLNPEWEFTVRFNYSNVLLCQGELEEAVDVIMEAVPESNRNSLEVSAVGNALYLCERYDEALTWFLRGRSLNGMDSYSVYFAGATLLKLRRSAEAFVYLEECIKIENDAGESKLKPFAYILTGDVDKGLAEMNRNLKQGDLLTMINASSIHCFAGSEKESMESFGGLWDNRELSLYAYLKLTHDLDCIRQNEKFREFYRQIFPEE